jgi:starvation-inducible DNA-binding protein
MLVDLLKTLLGTQFAHYVKAHGFHWNVETQDFYQYHKFFQKIYEDAYEAIDPTAEYIRSLGEYAPGSMERLLELSVIPGQSKIPRARLMVEELLADSEILVDLLNQCFAAATEENKQDVANFIAERLSQTNKFAWQLRATLKEGRA